MNASIFNEVLGPIMIGPSSSHTAGPARIGKMGWQLLGEPVKKILAFMAVTSYADHCTSHQSKMVDAITLATCRSFFSSTYSFAW